MVEDFELLMGSDGATTGSTAAPPFSAPSFLPKLPRRIQWCQTDHSVEGHPLQPPVHVGTPQVGLQVITYNLSKEVWMRNFRVTKF